MNTPQLPTDNLYKFIALSGVMLALTSLFVPSFYAYNIDLELAKLSIEEKVLGREIAFVEREIRRAENLKSKGELTEERSDKLRTNNLNNDKMETRRKATEEFVEAKQSLSKLFILIGFVCFVGFFVMASIGFRFWWTRVQKYLDTELKTRVDDMVSSNQTRQA